MSSSNVRVVRSGKKLAIVRGLTAIVGPIEGSIVDLENEARKLEDPAEKEIALTAIDIFKSK